MLTQQGKKIDKMNALMDFLCDHYGVKKEDVLSKRRFSELVKVRRMFAYILYRLDPNGFYAINSQGNLRRTSFVSTIELGDYFGQCNHTTTLKYIRDMDADVMFGVSSTLKEVRDLLDKIGCDEISEAFEEEILMSRQNILKTR